MPVALVVDPLLTSPDSMRELSHESWTFVLVETPAKAIAAIHAVVFDAVAVSSAAVDQREYEPLFSAMRLVAPTTRLVVVARKMAQPTLFLAEGFPESSLAE